jgi:outer membrane immunogenic protein
MSLAAVAVVSMANGFAAHAADLYGGPRQPPPEPTYVSPIDTARWSGAYLGIAYGYSDGISTITGGSGNFDLDQSGGLGSIYGGYNWQFGRIVAGLEAEIGTGTYDGSVGSGAGLVSSELNTLAAIRGRVGYLLSPAFLLYGTAGFASADMDFKANTISQSDWISGYQVGAGTELNVAGPWTLRLEYLYTGLDSQTLTHGGVTNTYEPDFHTVRAGVSFKF